MQIGDEPAHSGTQEGAEEPVDEAFGSKRVARATRQQRGERHECAEQQYAGDDPAEHQSAFTSNWANRSAYA
jgi:hypothetical protein